MTWSDLGDTTCLHDLLKEEEYSLRIPIERRVKGVGQYVYELRHYLKCSVEFWITDSGQR